MSVQLTLDTTERGREEPVGGMRGPKGVRVGYRVEAERSWWIVESIPEPGVATCRLIGGSGAYRRFRARGIAKVERGEVA